MDAALPGLPHEQSPQRLRPVAHGANHEARAVADHVHGDHAGGVLARAGAHVLDVVARAEMVMVRIRVDHLLGAEEDQLDRGVRAVSYTHLTLPTILRV